VVSGQATSAAMRRASYAERDRNRSLDPGALDFTAEEDEEDEEDRELTKPEAELGPRSLQRALKILQKRSEIPSDGKISFRLMISFTNGFNFLIIGMWRSLA
jgi:hypothetical protein